MIYLVFSALLLLTTTYADDEESIHYSVVKSMFEKRCIKNASPEAAQDLLEYAKLLSRCIPKEDLVPLEGESGHERLNYVCSAFRAQTEACVRKLGTKIEPCLHKEEAYLHDFLVATVNETFVKLCSEESRALRKDLDTKDVAHCMDHQINIFGKCVKQSGLIGAFSEPDPVVKKYDFCTILFKITECVQKKTHEKCKDKAVAEYIGSRYNGLTSQCDCHEEDHHQH